jgi:hypothetical protein
MVRIRQGWNVVALGVALGLGLGLLASCKKDDKSGTSTGDQTADKGGAVSGDLALLPVDSELVIGINAEQIQSSPLYKKFVEPLVKSGGMRGRMTDVAARCGIDPMTSAKSAAIGVKGARGDKPVMVIVAHGVDKAKLLDCADKVKDDAAKEGAELTRNGDIVLLKDKHGQGAVAFVNDSTLVALFSDTADAAAVKALAAGGSGLKSSQAFLDMYKKVKTGDSVWMVASGKVLDELPVKATAAFGSLNVTDGLTVDGRMRFDTPDAATQAAELLRGQGKQAAAYIDKVDVTAEGTEVHASAVVSNQKLQSLMPLLTMVLGGMGE